MDPSDEARIRALLKLERYGENVRAADPEPAADAIGADAALGFAWTSPRMSVTAYRFGDYPHASAAVDELSAAHGEPSMGSVNGSLALWVQTDDPDAQDLVDQLVGDFAGAE